MAIPEVSSYLPPFAHNGVKIPPATPLFQSTAVQPLLQKREVEYVVGLDGATNVAMAPNSSGLFLDQNENVLWVVATDQNGGKSLVKGYHIGDEYIPPKPVTLEDLMVQMQSMNERLNKMEGASNGQSNLKPAGQSEPDGANAQSGIRNGQSNAIVKSDGGLVQPG